MDKIHVLNLEEAQQRSIEILAKEAVKMIEDEGVLNKYFFDKNKIKIRNSEKTTTREKEIVSRTLLRLKKELSIESNSELEKKITSLAIREAELERSRLIKKNYKNQSEKRNKIKIEKPNANPIEIKEELEKLNERQAIDEAINAVSISHTTFPRWISGKSPIRTLGYLEVISSLYVNRETNELLEKREKSVFFQELIAFYIEEMYEKECLYNSENDDKSYAYYGKSMDYVEVIETKFLQESPVEQKKIAEDMIRYFEKFC